MQIHSVSTAWSYSLNENIYERKQRNQRLKLQFQGSLTIEQPMNRGWAYSTKRIIGRDDDFEAAKADQDEIHLTDIVPRDTEPDEGIRRETTPIASRAKSCSRFCGSVGD